jgi:hypothetical protein
MVDVLVEDDRSGYEIPIIDRYNTNTDIGYRLYISTNKRLYFKVGFGTNNIHYISRSFADFFSKRVLIYCSSVASTTLSILNITIDDTETVVPSRDSIRTTSVVYSSSSKILHSPTFFTDYITLIGAYNIGTKTNIIPNLQSKMMLYGLKISEYIDFSQRDGENLPKDDTKDLLYLSCNEGNLRNVYDGKYNSFDRYDDKMTITYGYNWINYYTAITKKGILYVHGLVSLNISSSKDQITNEEWCYSNV